MRHLFIRRFLAVPYLVTVLLLSCIASSPLALARNTNITTPTEKIHPSFMTQSTPQVVSTATVSQGNDQSSGETVHRSLRSTRSKPSTSLPQTEATSISLPSTVAPNASTTVNFNGIGQTNWRPSDSNAAAGLYNVIETVNSQFAVYNRNGGSPLYENTFNKWFSTSGKLFDPKVVYDPRGGRFIFLVTSGTALHIAVARQSNGIGEWCNYKISTEKGFADFPQLGVGVYGIYATANIYASSEDETFVTSELFSIPRTQMEQCQSVTVTSWTNLYNPGLFGSLAFSIVPAVMGTAGGSDEYFVNSSSSGGCSLTLWKLTGTDLSNDDVSTPCYSSPKTSAVQPGTSATIDVGDNRLYQADFRNGLLNVALTDNHDWGDGNINTVIRWFKINTNTQSVAQSGGFGHPGVWFFYPGFAQGTSGKSIFIYDVSSKDDYPSILYIGLTQDGNLEDNTWLIAGSGSYSQSSWGDYQSAWLDPTDGKQTWICGQYAAGNDSWGTQIAAVTA